MSLTDVVFGFDATVTEAIDAFVAHANNDHGDTVALVARLAPTPLEVPYAEIIVADPHGVTIRAADDRDGAGVRVELPEPCDSADQFSAQLLGLVYAARERVGDAVPLSSLEREYASTATIPMHRARVRAVDVVTPSLLAVELDGLDAFETLGPDTFAYALVTADGSTIDPAFTISDYSALPEDTPIRGAYYTVRHWDAAAHVLTLWVVSHGHADGVAGWMAAAQPGDDLLLWGPRRGFVPPDDADHLLIVVDETGLAAAASLIEDAADDVQIVAVLETHGPADRPPLPAHPGLTMHWVDRGDAEPGSGEALTAAALAVDVSVGTWAAFGGAESHVITHIRSRLRHERGLPASHVSMTGYWRRA